MKKIILKSLIILQILFGINLINNTYALYWVDPKIESIFDNFVVNLEKKLNTSDEIIFLTNLNNKIQPLLDSGNLALEKEKIFIDILKLSNEKIFSLQTDGLLVNSNQLLLEQSIVNALSEELKNYNKPSYYSKLSNVIHVSAKSEFVENNRIKKVSYEKYELVKSSNYLWYTDKKWLFLLEENWEIHYVESSVIFDKIPYSQANKYTYDSIWVKKMYIEREQNFYSYNFKNYISFADKYWFYESYFTKEWKKVSEQLLYIWDDNSYSFVENYTQAKLIDWSLIYGVTDKYTFLNHLVNDKLHLTWETDNLFIQLKSEIDILTRWLSYDEKIKAIYGWTLWKVKYTEVLDINDKKIFSWILSYKNNDGVCEWYVKLASYALMFAWISDTEVIRWDVVDAQDFPEIGHAWLRIWESYYDPTFDDPIWQKKQKTYSEYTYFDLPKDLLYSNRFSYWETPESLKNTSLEHRVTFVNSRLSDLSDKYKNDDYLVLKWVTFMKNAWLKVWEKITLEKAKNIFPYGEVYEKENWEILLKDAWVEKNITKIQFYIVNDSTINQIFSQINYDTEGYYLFKWNKLDWTFEYRVWFDVVIR